MKYLNFFKKKPQDACDALENWAAQDVNILDEFGATNFTTKQLLIMKLSFQAQTERLQAQQKLLTWFALSSLGWALLGLAAFMLNFLFIAKIIFYCSPLTLVAWLGFLVFLRTQNDRIPEFSERIYLIDKELERRRDVLFF